MIETNNSSNFLLELEQEIIKSIHKYVDLGDQFLNLPDSEVFDDKAITIKIQNLTRIVFCIDNKKFYIVSAATKLPKDKFVELFDDDKYQYSLPDQLNASKVEKRLLERFSDGPFSLFSCDEFYRLLYKYHKKSNSPNNTINEDNLKNSLRKYNFSNSNSEFEVQLKDFVFDVFFKSEQRFAIKLFEEVYSTYQLKDFLFNFITDENKLLFFFENLKNPFGDFEKKFLFSISQKIPRFNLLSFYQNLLLVRNEMTFDNLTLIANELGDDFFKLFEESNIKLVVTPQFNKHYFNKNPNKNFDHKFDNLVKDKKIELVEVNILLKNLEGYSKYINGIYNTFVNILGDDEAKAENLKKIISNFNSKENDFFIILKTISLFKNQLSKKEIVLFEKILRDCNNNLFDFSEQLKLN